MNFDLHTSRRVRAIVERWMIQRPGKWIRWSRRSRLLAEIEAFRAGGGLTALISDYPARAKLRALRAEHLFPVVVSNGEHLGLKRLKPCPDALLIAASELGIQPGDCQVIGDRVDADGAAAAAAGMSFRLIR